MPQNSSASPLAQEWNTIIESDNPRAIVQFFNDHAKEVEAMESVERASLLNQKNSTYHHSALGYAITADPSLETAKRMISLGADVDSAVNGGISALLDAPDLRKNLGKHPDLVKILLEKGVGEHDLQYTPYPPIPEPPPTEKPDKRINSEFIINLREWAVKKGHVDIIRMLLERDKKFFKNPPTLDDLEIGYNGVLSLDQYSLNDAQEKWNKAKQENDANNTTMLAKAIEGNHLEIAKLIDATHPELLSVIGKDLGYNPMHLATSKEMVEWLHGKNKDWIHDGDVEEMSPLHSAVVNEHEEVAKTLIDLGVDVNARNQSKRTPLHYVTSKKMIDLLIGADAEVNARGLDGATPFDHLYYLDGYELRNELRDYLKTYGGMGWRELEEETKKPQENKETPQSAIAPAAKRFEVAAASPDEHLSPTSIALAQNNPAIRTPSIRS